MYIVVLKKMGFRARREIWGLPPPCQVGRVPGCGADHILPSPHVLSVLVLRLSLGFVTQLFNILIFKHILKTLKMYSPEICFLFCIVE